MKKNTEFRLYGILGYPIGHTLSPVMQEAAFSNLGIKAFYLALELEHRHFKKTMKGLSRLILEGFNVTIPYKEKVIPYLDRVTPEAGGIGAVNTVFRKGKRWVGANTDVAGFLESLKKEGKFLPRGKKILVVGAGGGARAVIYGLAKGGASTITVANRPKEMARSVAKHFKKIFPKTRIKPFGIRDKTVKEAMVSSDLIVNATPVGLSPKDPLLIPEGWFPKAGGKKKLFFDLIYRPAKTRFLKIAEKRGHRILNGLGMLLFQGARSFECWTERKAPLSVMRQALIRGLEIKE